MAYLGTVCAILLAVLPGEEAYRAGKEAELEARYRDAVHAYVACAEREGPLAPYARIRAAVCLRLRNDTRAAIDNLSAVIRESQEGPWLALAEHELGRSYYEERRHDTAAAHFQRAHVAPVDLWWFDDLRWLAAENLLQIPASRPEAITYFRDAAGRSPWPGKRRAASRIVLSTGNPSDLLRGAKGLTRSRAYDEAHKVLKDLEPKVSGRKGLEAQWRYAMARLLLARQELEEGNAMLEALAESFPGEPLARQALSDLIAGDLRQKDFETAEATLARLNKWDARSSESVAAHGLLARAYAREKRLEEAIDHYRSVVDLSHDAGARRRALLEQGKAYRALSNRTEALDVYRGIIEDYPRTDSAVEAAFWSGELLRENGAKVPALEQYRYAVKYGITRYYGYRAQEALARLGDESARSMPRLPTNGGDALLRPLALERATATLASQPAPDEDPLFARLRFFGLEGYDEAEWEAMYIGRDLGADPADALHYQAIGEAGTAYTAMQIADANGFGEIGDGTQTLDRLRVRYPLAYRETVAAAAAEVDLDPYIILSIARQESTYRPGLVSPAGAVGVMQVMPRTAKSLVGEIPDLAPMQELGLKHPPTSIRLGAHYLRRMLDRYDGNLVYALASYNAGPSNCDAWRRRFAGQSLDMFVEAIPFTETQNYVKRVLAHYATYHSLYPPTL